MTSFTFSAEQVRSAPPEVRRWIESEINRALRVLTNAPAEPAKVEESALAICTVDEITEILKLISGKFLVTQVLFELAREAPFRQATPPLHTFNISEILHQAQLADVNQLFECFNIINRALQRVRNNPEVSLFGFDDRGHGYIHETTYRNIRQVWEQLVLAHSLAASNQTAGAADLAPIGAAPVRDGFSQPVMRPEHAFGGEQTS